MYKIISISAQEIDWYLEPTITEAKTIIQVYKDLELVKVEVEGDLKGLKNLDNVWIVPPKYNEIIIFPSSKTIKASARNLRSRAHYYNYQGIIIKDIPKQIEKEFVRQRILDRRIKSLEKGFALFPKIRFDLVEKVKDENYGYKIKYVAINSRGDTIIDNIKNSIRIVDKEYIFNNGKLINKKGMVLHDFGEEVLKRIFENGWMTSFTKEGNLLYDENFRLITSDDKRIEEVFDSKFYRSYDKSWNSFLSKIDGTIINEQPCNRIFKIDASNCFSFEFKDRRKAYVYNGDSNQFFQLNYKFNERYGDERKRDFLQSVFEEDGHGVLDVRSGELIVDLDHGYTEVYQNYIVTAAKTMKKGRKAFNFYSILDRKGKLIKKVFSREPKVFENYIILKTEDNYNLYDENFDTLMVLKAENEYYFNDHKRTINYVYSYDGKRMNYFLKDIVNGELKPYGNFDALGPRGLPRKPIDLYPIRGTNGLIGAINHSQEFVIPIVLDDIINVLDNSQDLIIVKKDGKLGLLRYP